MLSKVDVEQDIPRRFGKECAPKHRVTAAPDLEQKARDFGAPRHNSPSATMLVKPPRAITR